MSTFGDTFGKTWVPLGSKLNYPVIPDSALTFEGESEYITFENESEVITFEN